MDPKKSPILDPKLKEVYERVMGTQMPNSPQTVAVPQNPAQPTTTRPQPVFPQQLQTQKVFVAGQNVSKTGGSKTTYILLFIASIIFFAVYTLFWMRYFNIAIPLPF